MAAIAVAKPTKKSKEVDKMIKSLFGIDRVRDIKADECVMCRKPADKFRDVPSAKEYKISGLCQVCQDSTF